MGGEGCPSPSGLMLEVNLVQGYHFLNVKSVARTAKGVGHRDNVVEVAHNVIVVDLHGLGAVVIVANIASLKLIIFSQGIVVKQLGNVPHACLYLLDVLFCCLHNLGAELLLPPVLKGWCCRLFYVSDAKVILFSIATKYLSKKFQKKVIFSSFSSKIGVSDSKITLI